mmetsp:Transcript_39930/g.66399  ORF Transcript_39930/g.66399 Transcript_39930/m.66399 type:complete len:294 (-) Transcript_39930:186-1067(-)
MALEASNASPISHVVHARSHVSRCCHQLGAAGVKADVQHLVSVPPQCKNALPRFDIPDFACSVDGARDTEIPCKIELRGANLPTMALERVDASTRPHIPKLACVIERSSDNEVTIGVEIERHDLGGVAQQRVQLRAGVHIPKLGCVVHTSGSNERALGIKAQADNLRQVPPQRVKAVPRLRVPNFAGFIKRPSNNTIPKGIVEGDCVHDILMSIQRQKFVTCHSIPYFATSVVRTGDEFVTRLVEGTVCQRQDVGTKHLKQIKKLLPIAGHTSHQLLEQLPNLRLPGLGNQRL